MDVQKVMDKINEIFYISDPDTYELLCAEKAAGAAKRFYKLVERRHRSYNCAL